MYRDFLLIKKMKQGDDAAFDSFVYKYYPKILLYCHYHCPDKAYAEDMTQETFVRFFTKLSDYHFKGKTLNYLYTIAGNLCKDYLKKTRELPVAAEEAEGSQIEHVLTKILVEQALERLPDELREVIILYYFQERKLTEISDLLQIGLPLVKYRLRRAKKLLEKSLREEDPHEAGKKEEAVSEKSIH